MILNLAGRIEKVLSTYRRKGASDVRLRATTVEGEPLPVVLDRTAIESWDLAREGDLGGLAAAIEAVARDAADELGGGLRAFMLTTSYKGAGKGRVRKGTRITVRGTQTGVADLEASSEGGQILQQMRHNEDLHVLAAEQAAEAFEAQKNTIREVAAERDRWRARAIELERQWDGLADAKLQLAAKYEDLMDRSLERDLRRRAAENSLTNRKKIVDEVLAPVGAPFLTRVVSGLLGDTREAADSSEMLALVDSIVRGMTEQKFAALADLPQLTDGDRLSIARLLSLRSKALRLAEEKAKTAGAAPAAGATP